MKKLKKFMFVVFTMTMLIYTDKSGHKMVYTSYIVMMLKLRSFQRDTEGIIVKKRWMS